MAISKVVLNGVTQMDVTNVTATAATIRSTYTALDASGQLVTGTYEGGGGSAPVITSLSVTPTEEEQVFNSSSVTVPNKASFISMQGLNRAYGYYMGNNLFEEGVTYSVYGELESSSIIIDGTFTLSWINYNSYYYCYLPYTTTDSNVTHVELLKFSNGNIYIVVLTYGQGVSTNTPIVFSVDAFVPVTIGAISSTYIGSGVPTKSSANMTANGATVTAPSGYYSSNGTYTISGGAAFTPATTLTTSPAITVNSSGLITATNSYSTSITPTVTAGYVSVGTAGIVSVAGSKTSQLTTIAATTYNVSTANQTISSARYLTGTQTIRGVTTTNLSASNILSGVTIQVGDSANASRIATVTGNVAFVTYYTGSSAPSSSLGTNGDIYLQS